MRLSLWFVGSNETACYLFWVVLYFWRDNYLIKFVNLSYKEVNSVLVLLEKVNDWYSCYLDILDQINHSYSKNKMPQ